MDLRRVLQMGAGAMNDCKTYAHSEIDGQAQAREINEGEW